MSARLICAAMVLAAVGASGCSLAKQEAPALSGPSEFGESLSVTATPDRLSQDGVSQVRVEATVRDSQGKPKAGVTVQWQVSATNGAFVEPSTQQSTTDGQGRAAMVVTAPTPPAFLPTSPARLTITARAVGTDAISTTNFRTVEVQLIPPAGTLPVNNPPVAAFTISPVIGNINQSITFDASLTKDEGEPCESLCTYQWDFGDFETNGGKIVTKSFSRPATYTITLTVTDSRGGVDSDSRQLVIRGPEAPVARLTITPTSAVGGTTIAFNAAGSTVGLGATIDEYVWDFGDGTSTTTTVPVTSKVYPAVALGGQNVNYPVVVTIKDNFGRTSVATGTVTVTAPAAP